MDELTDGLRPGAFYWIWIVLDPDADHEWENKPMPARYDGDGRWHCLACGPATDWPVKWVGPEIVCPL